MSTKRKMHENEVPINAALVRGLISSQFPRWAGLPVRPVEVDGWDNTTFRLGARMSVRLPSAARYASQVEKEQRWLPRLAPHLPHPIPVPLAKGEPGLGYPYPWSVYRWIAGETATAERIADPVAFAMDLAGFLRALYRIDPAGGPPPGRHNFFRGGPLTVYDGETRQALAALEGRVDTAAALEVWEAALTAGWRGAPVWFHGDVARGNLLVQNGRLCAVIDFGTSGVGDPSCDLAVAYTLLGDEGRRAFREAVGLDRATWARGRGWTLWKALITLAGTSDSASPANEEARRSLVEILADHAHDA